MVPVAYRSPILIDAFFARPTALCAPQRVERSDQIEGTEATCGPRRPKGLVVATQGHGKHPAAASRRRTAASYRGILLSTDALPTPTSDASEVAPEKCGFAKHRRAAADAATDDALFRVLAPVAARVPTEMARPAVPAKMRHHQRLQGHALRRCSAGVERDCRRSVLWTPPATQTCTVVHV